MSRAALYAYAHGKEPPRTLDSRFRESDGAASYGRGTGGFETHPYGTRHDRALAIALGGQARAYPFLAGQLVEPESRGDVFQGDAV